MVAGCAAQRPAQVITPEQHAANIAAAQQAGFKVVSSVDRTLFCATAPDTGSHMAPACISEAEWQARMGARRDVSTAARYTNQSPGPGSGSGH